VFIRHPNGAELVEDVAQEEYTRMPEALGRRVEKITTPCEIRISCLVTGRLVSARRCDLRRR
jgi:hypothetical protein